MTNPSHDVATTLFVLPPDANLLLVRDLAPRLRSKLGPVDGEDVVVTRPGFRVVTRLITPPLAALLTEFRTASLLTDAVARFSRTQEQDPFEVLDLSFDALATFIQGRILVASHSPDAQAAAPSLAAGQEFAGLEIEQLVRSLDDTEVYRARTGRGEVAALKVARDDRAASMLAHETRMLARLGGGLTPRLLDHGTHEGRAWLAMEWRKGVPVSVAAQQARAAHDRFRLHRLVGELLSSYALLHAHGVIHGDVHTGNVLVDDDGGITILDFGRARLAEETSATDPERAGIAHFYDPQMAAAVLAGAIPPAASRIAEQYALGVLAYMLLTGLHPIHPVAEQRELLARIVARHPLPFVARGIEAWPRVEEVLRQALSKAPGERFADTTAFARAFHEAGVPRRAPVGSDPATERVLASLRTSEPLSGARPAFLAWLALRAALTRSDAELLAIADLLASRAGDDWEECAVAIEVARARSDGQDMRDGVNQFMAAADTVADDAERCRALLYAARVLEGAEARTVDLTALRKWTEQRFGELWSGPDAEEGIIHAALALNQAGVLPQPAELRTRLDTLEGGSLWLWALAHDVFQEPHYLTRAITAPRPRAPLQNGLACLRLYQLTGEMHWVDAAQRLAANTNSAAPDLDATLLMIELEAPARALPPAFLRYALS